MGSFDTEAQKEVRSWLLRYLSELVWETFRKAVTPFIEYDRRVMCLAEAILEDEEQLDEVDRLVQHFVGLVFHVGIIMDRIAHGQLSEDIVELIHTADRHWARMQNDGKKYDQSSVLQYHLIDDLKLQAILAFLKRTSELNSASDLCDKLWSGDCFNAKRAQIKNTLSMDAVTAAKDAVTLKLDVTSSLAVVHSNLPDCLLLEFVQDMSAAGLSQSSVCKPLSASLSVENLVKNYWRRKLLLPAPRGNARNPAGRHSQPSAQHEMLSARLHRKQARAERASRMPRDAGSSSSCSEEDSARAVPVPNDEGVHDRVTSRYFVASNSRTDPSTDQPIECSSSSSDKSKSKTSPPCPARLHRHAGRKQASISNSRQRVVSFANTTDYVSVSGPSTRLQCSAASGLGPPARSSALKHPSKKRQRWSANDEERLYKGVQQFGYSKWLLIKHRQGLLNKTAVQIKDKWRNLTDNQERMGELTAKFGPLKSDLAPASYQLRSNTS